MNRINQSATSSAPTWRMMGIPVENRWINIGHCSEKTRKNDEVGIWKRDVSYVEKLSRKGDKSAHNAKWKRVAQIGRA